jgi:dsRNA-specific ribonuclease
VQTLCQLRQIKGNPLILTQSLTSPNKSKTYNYQGLETIGDSVLKAIISLLLYQLNPHLNEGHLTAYRTRLIRNDYLSLLGVLNYLHFFIIKV